MARVLGEAGKFVMDESDRKWRQMVTVPFLAIGLLFWISGVLVGSLAYKKLWWVSLLVNGLAVAAFLMVRWWVYRHMDQLSKERKEFLHGAYGEISVGYRLLDFPDGFYIINDLKTESGNLDHVVIGSTGVFALDTKNWRGIVAADGKGELLLNNRPTDKPLLKQFVGRVMGIMDRVKALASGVDPYVQAVFVFTSARVDANWGTTGNVHCIRDDQLYDYIVESKMGKRLNTKEVKTIARALAALARMDPLFSDKVTAKGGIKAISPEATKPTAPGSLGKFE